MTYRLQLAYCLASFQNKSAVISSFPTVFSTLFEKFPPFSSNLKLLPANSFNLEESKIFRLDKIVDSFKFKAFADDKLTLAQTECDYQHFLLFPQCFQNPSLAWSLNIRIM